MRHFVVVGLVAIASTAAAQNRTMPPEAERQLARAIYKEMVEIKSGFTTGATTPVVDAVAKRLKAAGFPAADIFVGGASCGRLAGSWPGMTFTGAPLKLAAGQFGLGHGDGAHATDEYWIIDSANPKVAGMNGAIQSFVEFFYACRG